MARYASFASQADFVKKIVLPRFYFFAPQVYAGEVLVAVSLMLGLFTRLGGFIGALMAINLWLGLYRSQSEWPWTYFFLVVIQIMFMAHRSSRSLGLDALIHREKPAAAGDHRRTRLANLVA